MNIFIFIYGALGYVAFLAAFSYAIGFVGGFLVPKGIDDGPSSPFWPSVLVNVLLLSIFAVQHSVMARLSFKKRFVSERLDRATFVFLTSLILGLMYWQWRPLPDVVWEVASPGFRMAIHALYFLGWAVVLLSTFMIDHFHLFGLKQAFWNLRGERIREPVFNDPLFYRYSRHPLMLGFIIAFWSAPTMSEGRLLFAVVTTVYIFIAVRLEERDLVTLHGDAYLKYQGSVPMIFPWPR